MPVYVYAGGEVVSAKVWQIDPSDMSKIAESAGYGGYIWALTTDGSYVYCGGNITQKVWKIRISDMVKVAESIDYGGSIYALTAIGSYVYCGGGVAKKVWKIRISDMVKVAESLDYGGYIYALTIDGSYIYAGGGVTQKVRQYDPSDMSMVAQSIAYGGDIKALTALGSYIYCGGYSPRTVWQIDPSDMSKIAESAGYDGAPGQIMALTALTPYVYAGGTGFAGQRTVWQINPTNMSKVDESISYGDGIYALTALGSYVYCGGYTTNKVWKIDPSDMSKVAESISYGGGIMALADYAPVVAPTVTTQACTNVQATTATGNGNITDTGGENCTRRGFCYKVGTTGDPTTADSVAYDDGSFGTGAYTKGLTGLSPGTSYRVRAYAINSAGTGYGTTVQILTKPAAPTNVAATDGAHTDKVVVTWTKSTGATGYQVYRDGTPLGWLGDVATFDDTGAGAPTITPGSADASDGLFEAHVALSLSGQSANNGATHTYKVRARNATGESVDSGTNTGYRGVGALTYQWQRSAADSDADYSNISGATTASYNDTGAPANGDGRYYRCVENATGAAEQTSSSDRGYRLVPGWTGKVSGVTNPAKVMGVAVANIAKVKGVA